MNFEQFCNHFDQLYAKKDDSNKNNDNSMQVEESKALLDYPEAGKEEFMPEDNFHYYIPKGAASYDFGAYIVNNDGQVRHWKLIKYSLLKTT